MTIKKSTLYYWAIIFVLEFLLVAYLQGLLGPGLIPGPTPVPVRDKIVCISQEELTAVQRILNRFEGNWNDGLYSDISDAIGGLDFDMGGPKDGVTQEVQEQIINEFTGGRDFLESLADVRSKLTTK
jgi:hypothetical protein